MKRPVMRVVTVLVAVLPTLGAAAGASTQVVSRCDGNGYGDRRIVMGTHFPDFIDCSVSSGDLVVFGLGGDYKIPGDSGSDVM